MQMAAGREHGQSDRSRYSSWMEADLQKKGKNIKAGQKILSKEKFLRRYYSTSTSTTLPQNVSST